MVICIGGEQRGEIGVPLDPLRIMMPDSGSFTDVEFVLVKGQGRFTHQDRQLDITGEAIAEFVPESTGRYRIECRVNGKPVGCFKGLVTGERRERPQPLPSFDLSGEETDKGVESVVIADMIAEELRMEAERRAETAVPKPIPIPIPVPPTMSAHQSNLAELQPLLEPEPEADPELEAWLAMSAPEEPIMPPPKKKNGHPLRGTAQMLLAIAAAVSVTFVLAFGAAAITERASRPSPVTPSVTQESVAKTPLDCRSSKVFVQHGKLMISGCSVRR